MFCHAASNCRPGTASLLHVDQPCSRHIDAEQAGHIPRAIDALPGQSGGRARWTARLPAIMGQQIGGTGPPFDQGSALPGFPLRLSSRPPSHKRTNPKKIDYKSIAAAASRPKKEPARRENAAKTVIVKREGREGE
jgi:hypothetical protein